MPQAVFGEDARPARYHAARAEARPLSCPRIGDADGADALRQRGKRAVVIAAAIAQPMALRVKGQKRHQQKRRGITRGQCATGS